MAETPPLVEEDNLLRRSTSLRHPDVPVPGDKVPWQYQNRADPSKYTYKLICLGKDLIVYDDSEPESEKKTTCKSKPKNTKPKTPTTDDPGSLQTKEKIQMASANYKDFDNPAANLSDPPTLDPQNPAPKLKNYKPTYRYYLTEAQDFDYGTMLAIFSVCRSHDEACIRPIMELMPDALFAIQTIKESLNAEERKNGTKKEWELAQLFYFLVDGGLACLFLEQREASGLRGLVEVRECIQAEADAEEQQEKKVIARKPSVIRRLLGLPPKKPRKLPTEEDIRRMEEIIMAIRII
ncbi:hypothetical protein TWF281_008417 [Arthrobotrys megalospora]